MNKGLLKTLSFVLAGPFIEISSIWTDLRILKIMKVLNYIQLSPSQIKLISDVVKKKKDCKLLVFGLGYDSIFWNRINRKGTTVFIEDNEEWLEKISRKCKKLSIHHVQYKTRRKDWEQLLGKLNEIDIPLPEQVLAEKWDVILVDAPNGDHEQAPGRMLSIFSALILVKASGSIFVHDCNRLVEDTYANFYLKNENLIHEIKAKNGFLRHYYMKHKL
ncbi:hypothetical protein ACFLYK_03435 [Candidatus Cloacimonadota bacterium]